MVVRSMFLATARGLKFVGHLWSIYVLEATVFTSAGSEGSTATELGGRNRGGTARKSLCRG